MRFVDDQICVIKLWIHYRYLTLLIYAWRTHRQLRSRHVPTNEDTRLIFNIYHHRLDDTSCLAPDTLIQMRSTNGIIKKRFTQGIFIEKIVEKWTDNHSRLNKKWVWKSAIDGLIFIQKSEMAFAVAQSITGLEIIGIRQPKPNRKIFLWVEFQLDCRAKSIFTLVYVVLSLEIRAAQFSRCCRYQSTPWTPTLWFGGYWQCNRLSKDKRVWFNVKTKTKIDSFKSLLGV
jgi:hypothetical protein